VLKAYLDGSGKVKYSDYVALGGCAGESNILRCLESDWAMMLSSRSPAAPYLHLSEMTKPREFRHPEWTDAWVRQLINDAITFLASWRLRTEIVTTCVAVDAREHRNLVNLGATIGSIGSICANVSFGSILSDYANIHPEISRDERADIFFDQNEEFLRHLYDAWCKGKKVKEYDFWGRVNTVQPIRCKDHAEGQIADFIAWAETRSHNHSNSWAERIWERLNPILPNFTFLPLNKETLWNKHGHSVIMKP
jgi:hypothetical protein